MSIYLSCRNWDANSYDNSLLFLDFVTFKTELNIFFRTQIETIMSMKTILRQRRLAHITCFLYVLKLGQMLEKSCKKWWIRYMTIYGPIDPRGERLHSVTGCVILIKAILVQPFHSWSLRKLMWLKTLPIRMF